MKNFSPLLTGVTGIEQRLCVRIFSFGNPDGGDITNIPLYIRIQKVLATHRIIPEGTAEFLKIPRRLIRKLHDPD